MSRKEVEEILRTENEINEATKELKKLTENNNKQKEIIPVKEEQKVIEKEKPLSRSIKERKELSELPPLYPITDETVLQNKKQKQHQKLTSFNDFVGMINYISDKSKLNTSKNDEKYNIIN